MPELALKGFVFSDTHMKVLEQRDDLYEALKANEWKGYVTDGGYEYQPYKGCFSCQSTEETGHTDTCIVGLALKKVENGTT